MSTMFIQTLLVLLVAIHVTLACECKPMTLLQAMCNSTTGSWSSSGEQCGKVVLARVSDGQPIEYEDLPYRSYLIDVSRLLRTEEKTKLYLDNNKGTLLFPERVSDCGGILTDGLDYVIAGYADINGELVTSTCYHYVPYEYLIIDPHAMNILANPGDCEDI